MMKLDVVMPCTARNLATVRSNLDLLRKWLPMRRLVLVAPAEAAREAEAWHEPDVVALDEADVLDCQAVRDIIRSRLPQAAGRAGWYIQQFLKMVYSFCCAEPYYLVWDADTVPCRPYRCFTSDGKPIFDLRGEFHKPYFETLAALFPGMGKNAQESYITEHMVVNAAYMRELIGEIGGAREFIRRILASVSLESLSGSGFSEFETYGTWCASRHPQSYGIRVWKSLRAGTRWFDAQHFNAAQARWVGRDYDAISFESWDRAKRGVLRRLLTGSCLARACLSFEKVRACLD